MDATTPETETGKSERIAELIMYFNSVSAPPPPSVVDLATLEQAFRISEQEAAARIGSAPDRIRPAQQHALQWFWISIPW